MKGKYFESIGLIERLYRLFLEVIKNELKRLNIIDINNIQTLILYHIGSNKITVGDLIHRGYYMGSNVSYNLKKLMANGYVTQTPSDFDKRSTFISLTKKGAVLCEKLDKVMESQMKMLKVEGINDKEIENLTGTLKKFESCFDKFSKPYAVS